MQRSKLKIDKRKWVVSKLIPQYADRLDTTVNAKVEITQAVDDLELGRFVETMAVTLMHKRIDQLVAEGKLIRVDAPLQYRQQRQLPSPSHAPSSAVIDLRAVPEPVTKPEPKPLSEFQAFQRQWHSDGRR